ncbi:nuclear transport factor 2 family protein [Saccharothrix syringae]|uniref:Nuclear transport factor 2 family protein n=1 Tax=Saccharothrix syringae TaxID=103733 RepID=A0A5Q0H6A2_SACSY|nr:nuclear transport factor 2 family protein [Saccharothrix syringae]QFZ21464.1 nuclear transport factor 2 family protein [Saccharothrix syringae]
MTSAPTLRALNHDVWHAFRSAYAALDAPAFLALHGEDLIRAGGPAGEVQGHAEYSAVTTSFFERVSGNGDAIAIEFRFTERLASDTAASERGLFRLTLTKSGETRDVYGRFHVFSRRTDRWRIVVDYDSDEGGTATAEAFDAATPVDDVDAFVR